MSARISPSDRERAQVAAAPTALARADGQLSLHFAVRGGRTVLAARDQREPLRVMTPRDRDLGTAGATLVNVAGGLAGGDRLHQQVTVAPGAAAAIGSQAAEKVYRTPGPETRVTTELHVDADGWLEWLPQETILFDRAALRRGLHAHLAASGRLLAGELLVLGRTASGEQIRGSSLLDAWRVSRGGRLAWADGLRLAPPNQAAIRAPAGFDGHLAVATVVYAAPNAGAVLATARDLLPDGKSHGGVRAGATAVTADLLLIRLLAPDGARLRAAVAGFWSGFRAAVAELPARLPRGWAL